MDKVEQYRSHAARALHDAEISNRSDRKQLLRELAEAWLELADMQARTPNLERRRFDQALRPYSERN